MLTDLKLQLFIRGITQTQVAQRAQVNLSFVSRIINGKGKCSPRVAEALRHFGIPEESMQEALARPSRPPAEFGIKISGKKRHKK